MTDQQAAATAVEAVYRAESRRVLATLIRLLGNFDLAEEALHEAFLAASQKWPEEGVPGNPRAWLVSAGRFRAIDRLRQRARFDAALVEITNDLQQEAESAPDDVDLTIPDDQLRLIFTCCHPAIAPEAQVALTLRELCGLTTEEIARAFLAATPAIAQRIVRAKAKIRDAHIPYAVPEGPELPQRLESVLRVIYLVFNEGYAAHFGEALTRPDLSGEAIRLGRLMAELMPDAETFGLLALMLLNESRRAARLSADGEVVLLADQDRGLWDGTMVAEGLALVKRAFATGEVGPYALQAAISAVHGVARSAAETDWGRIVTLYDMLLEAAPSPVVRLNRAVAVAMREGPQAGLAIVESLDADGELSGYHLLHATRADLNRRLGNHEAARAAYEKALALCGMEPERRFFEKRIREMRAAQG